MAADQALFCIKYPGSDQLRANGEVSTGEQPRCNLSHHRRIHLPEPSCYFTGATENCNVRDAVLPLLSVIESITL